MEAFVLPFQPLIIIGAARSGTKLLRDLIAQHPAIDRVPYDVNYIWRMGNEAQPDDALSPATLTDEMRQTIYDQLARFHDHAPILVEKTVSNCLRVDFVNALFPTAKFLHLTRDGVDVVESVYRQWNAPVDWRYLVRKARTFPLRQAPRYALSYTAGLVKRLRTDDHSQLAIWGPHYPGMEADLAQQDVLEVIAKQWAICVQSATAALDQLDPTRVISIRYEAFVETPLEHLQRIAHWLDVEAIYHQVTDLTTISADNVGKGHARLAVEQLNQILPIIHSVRNESVHV